MMIHPGVYQDISININIDKTCNVTISSHKFAQCTERKKTRIKQTETKKQEDDCQTKSYK